MGQRAKKAKVGASQTNYPFITKRYVIPDFSPTGAKAGLKPAKIAAPPQSLNSVLFSAAWPRRLWLGLRQLRRRLGRNRGMGTGHCKTTVFLKGLAAGSVPGLQLCIAGKHGHIWERCRAGRVLRLRLEFQVRQRLW